MYTHTHIYLIVRTIKYLSTLPLRNHHHWRSLDWIRINQDVSQEELLTMGIAEGLGSFSVVHPAPQSTVHSTTAAWHSAPFKPQPFIALTLFLRTCNSLSWSFQHYMEGRPGPSPQYIALLLVKQGKNWAWDMRRT